MIPLKDTVADNVAFALEGPLQAWGRGASQLSSGREMVKGVQKAIALSILAFPFTSAT